ncbi:MAG TPA: potassium-transporting ATPase subunit F [Microbacterium sp.]|nr:potassium-transporting ATPase subunit F [Microbacterium sp.]
MCSDKAVRPSPSRPAGSRNWSLCARRRLHPRHHRRVRGRRPHRKGGREAVIVFELLAVALGVAAVVYLVYALVKPERF